MPTNEERRKAAQKLRNSDIERHQLNPMVSHSTVTICGSSIVCIDEESLRIALDYLADLIEPESEINRDALLKVAKDIEEDAKELVKNQPLLSVLEAVMCTYANRIRKACGFVRHVER